MRGNYCWCILLLLFCKNSLTEGLKVKLNTTTAKVIDILLKDGEEYKPFDLDQDYQVTTLDFLT